MRGVILAGGTGSRLYPLTKITNKHLLPVYNKPMIYYPLEKLIEAGIKDILVVSGKGHAGHFLNLLGSGKEFGVRISYEIQDEEGGIAQALLLAENFSQGNPVCVILGDNIFEDSIKDDVESFEKGAKIFLKEVPDANRFGVAEVKKDKIIGIEEKPKNPKSKYAVTGLYMYDSSVYDFIRTLKPSGRGELEITDVNNYFINKREMKWKKVEGYWLDAGTFDSLMRASNVLKAKEDAKKAIKQP